MSQDSSSRTIVIQNKQGLHFRPADMLAKLANQYEADIDVTKDGVVVNAKSFLDIITLVAAHGAELEFKASGNDAEEALDAIEDFIVNYKDHEEVADPSQSDSQ